MGTMRTLKEKAITAKLDHTCIWCGEKIEPKHIYIYRAYLFDGFNTDHIHPECWEAMTAIEEFEPGKHVRGSNVVRSSY